MQKEPTRAKGVIAIYQQNFLSASMTFIYRQLLGVSDEFKPIILATTRNNRGRFPYPKIYERNLSTREFVYSRVLKKTTGRVPIMFSDRQEYWKEVLLEQEIKLVHAHFGPAGIDVLPVVAALGIPLLVTFHGSDASRLLRNPGYVSRLRDLFEYASVITVSHFMADQLSAFGARPERTFVHYIGAPVEEFEFVERKPVRMKISDSERVTFLQVANLIEKKGHAFTLEAFRNYSSRNPDCKLVLAGDGRLRRQLERTAAQMSIGDKVEFAGAVTKAEVIRLMRDADIFLHHSITAADGSQEGIPTVLMEAMAMGLVVISTFHSGIPELIEDTYNGLLVQERDVTGYTRRMFDCATVDDDLPKRAAATVNDRFNLAKQNQELKEIYRHVLQGQTIAPKS